MHYFNKMMLILLLLMAAGMGLWAAETAKQANAVPESIQKFIEGLNKHSYGTAAKYISKDFEIEGVPEEYMKQALSQLFSNFPMKITQYLNKSHRQGTYGTIYIISMNTNNRITDVEFELDKDNKVLSCSMLRAQRPGDMVSADNRTLNPYAEIDFELVNGIIIIPVELNGNNVKFILDTGAPMLVMNSQADSTGSNIVVGSAQGIGGSVQDMGFAHVSNFTWGGGSYQSFDTVSMDLSHLEAELGIKFVGLISKAELEPFETYFDYSNKKLKLYKLKDSGELEEPDKLSGWVSEVKLTVMGHIACLKAKVGKKQMTMGLDTGAQACLLDDDFLAKYEKELKNVQTDTLRGADLNMITVKTGDIAMTTVNKLSFPDLTYAFSDISEINNAYGLKINGILGYPFLSKQPVSINYRMKTLRFY